MQCFVEKGIPSKTIMIRELNNDGSYNIECPEHHKTKVNLQNPKFEILFETGCLSFLDGYNFESVSSFTAAFERFLEFCIKILYLNNNKEMNNFDTIWKHVKNQSERQYGAFLFLYFNEFREIEPFPDNRKEFRNNVIHKGYIPTAEETFDYGNFIYEFIKNLIRKFLNEKSELFNKITLWELSKKSNNQVLSSTMHMPTILSIVNMNASSTFRSDLDQLKERRYFFI